MLKVGEMFHNQDTDNKLKCIAGHYYGYIEEPSVRADPAAAST